MALSNPDSVAGSWLIPGSRALAVFFPEMSLALRHGRVTEREAERLLERRLMVTVLGALDDLGVHDRSLIDDLVQELALRLATMKAVERFDPSRASPATFLHGIARTLVREQYHRRERPKAVPPSEIDRVTEDGDQLRRAVRQERRRELCGWLDQLTPGELRAIIHEFGPFADYSPPVGPRRRPRNPDALPRAIEALRQLSAQQSRQ